MAINYPGPYEVRIRYTTPISGNTTFTHRLRLSMDMGTPADPGDPFSEWTALSRQGQTPQLDDWVDDLVALLQPLYHTGTTFVDAELWLYTPGTFDAAFQSTYPIALAGTSSTQNSLNAQAIITFRSQLGGSGRVNLMEAISGFGVEQGFPTNSALINALATFITALGSPVIARDGGYLFTPLKYLPGINEALFKKRFRQL